MKYLRSLYVQVLVAIVCGVLLGAVYPDWAVPLKPLGDGFIKLARFLPHQGDVQPRQP